MNNVNIPILGGMKMPADFKYAKCYLKGKPEHELFDEFSVKHPPMSVDKWAKIFAPFDALKGFGDTIKETETLSEET